MPVLKQFVALNLARFNRLRRKPPREIVTFLRKRSRHLLVHLRDYARVSFDAVELSDEQFLQALDLSKLNAAPSARGTDVEGVKRALIDHMRTRESPRFFFPRKERPGMLAMLDAQFPEARRSTLISADRYVQRRFSVLGHDVCFDGAIDWHATLVNDRRWPLTFSPNIDFISDTRRGDIKPAWELNRTQHFAVLGKAYWLRGDERYAIALTDQLASWIESNPYMRGINWMEGMEVALRMIAWMWAEHFCMDSAYFNAKVHYDMLKSLYTHAKYLEEHLSDKWQLNNNHLIVEAVGLVLMGVLYPEFKEAARWTAKGITILERELRSQIVPDGATWEQSTGYHKFMTDLCLLVVALLKANGMTVPEVIWSKTGEMIDCLNALQRGDGRIPLIGDEDQGRAVILSDTDYDDAGSTLAIGAGLFQRARWPRGPYEEALWLLGNYVPTDEPVRQQSKVLADSGYVVMRGDGTYLLFFTGSQNPNHLHSGHRHLDMLSIVLGARDNWYVVDPGVYTYYGDFEWRNYFRGLKAHNTVVVDDHNPVEIREVFETPHVPLTWLREHAVGGDHEWAEAVHNGYPTIRHTRKIFHVKPEYWILIDLLEGEGDHLYDLYYHLNHGVGLRLRNTDQSVTVTGHTGILEIRPLPTPGLNVAILDGMVSPRHGVKLNAPILRYRKRGAPPVSFVTVLHPQMNERLVQVSPIDVHGAEGNKLREDQATGIRLSFDGREDFFVWLHTDEPQRVSFEKFSTQKCKRAYIRTQGTSAATFCS